MYAHIFYEMYYKYKFVPMDLKNGDEQQRYPIRVPLISL